MTVNVISVLLKKLTGIAIESDETDQFELVIDYNKPKLKLKDEQSETAKRLWDEELLGVDIARQMGCNASYVTKLLQYWFDQRGLPRPNNKSRRKQLESKQTKLPLYKQIANDVQELMQKGHSNLEIARQLKTNDCNVAKAIKWWHETRGLPIPTAADRREQKLVRAQNMLDEGMLLKDIAKELDYSPRGLRLALEKYVADKGEVMPDGRSLRGNASSGNTANGKRSESDSNAA